MGEKHSKDGVFSRRDVIRIRRGLKAGTPTEVYAKEFSVRYQCIYDLAYGATHKDADGEEAPLAKGSLSGKHLKANERKEKVLKLIKEGHSQAEVSRQMQLSEGYVSLIVQGKR